MNRVRVNGFYKYQPNGWDRFKPCAGNTLEVGQVVRVINLPSAPKANTCGQCYVGELLTKRFLCMVATNSLVPLTADEKKTLRVAMSPAKYRKPTNHFVFEPSMESYYFPGDIEPHIKNSSVAKLFALFAQLEQAKQSNANLGVILPIESAISDTAQTARERILNASIRMRA